MRQMLLRYFAVSSRHHNIYAYLTKTEHIISHQSKGRRSTDDSANVMTN